MKLKLKLKQEKLANLTPAASNDTGKKTHTSCFFPACCSKAKNQ